MAHASVAFIHTRSPSNAAAHYAQATERVEERNEALAMLFAGVEAKAPHDGTLSQPRPSMPQTVADAVGAPTDRPLTIPELRSVVDGRRPDGQALPRAPKARHYEGGDADGKKGVKFIDLTLSADVSWSVAHANSATAAGAALVLSVVERAADKTLDDVEAKLGGQLGAWRHTHYTTRPFSDGTCAPDLHVQYAIPNAMVRPDGKLRAIDGRALLAMQKDHTIGRLFSHHLAEEGRAAGMRVETRNGATVLSDVPEAVREHFSRRSREGLANAITYTNGKGEVWDQLSPGQQRARIKNGVRATQGSHRDGMADRVAWRADCERLGWPATDVAGQERTAPVPRREQASLLSRAVGVRSAAVQTRLEARRHQQTAAMGHGPRPSLAVGTLLGVARVLQAGANALHQRQQTRTARRRDAFNSLHMAIRTNQATLAVAAVVHEMRPSTLRRRAEVIADAARATVGTVHGLRGEVRQRFTELRAEREMAPTAALTPWARADLRIRAEALRERAQSQSPEAARVAGRAMAVRRDRMMFEAIATARPAVLPVVSRQLEPSISEAQVLATHSALRKLAGLDADGAEKRNGEGFNRTDSRRGHELAAAASLSPQDAVEARTMLRKYWRQIGEDTLAAMGAKPLARRPGSATPELATKPQDKWGVVEQLADGLADSVVAGRMPYTMAIETLHGADREDAARGAKRNPVTGFISGGERPRRTEEQIETLMARALDRAEKRSATATDMGPWAAVAAQGRELGGQSGGTAVKGAPARRARR